MSEPKSPAAIERELRDAFKLFDRGGSGTITSDEFTAILTRPGGGKPFTIDEAVRLFRKADLNGAGVVDYGEFCNAWSMVRSGGAQDKWADLTDPEAAHQLLGLNLEGLREACELVGFPYRCYKDGMKSDAWAEGGWKYKYKRKDHPEMKWLDEAYPDDSRGQLCGGSRGYDFCCAIKAYLKANRREHQSICQVLLELGSKNVKPANLFLSHTQGVPIYETIRRMREAIEAHKAQLPSADESELFFWLGAPPPSSPPR